MMGGAIVHPDRKEVIALMPEAIIKQDGRAKTIVRETQPNDFWLNYDKIIRIWRSLSPRMG